MKIEAAGVLTFIWSLLTCSFHHCLYCTITQQQIGTTETRIHFAIIIMKTCYCFLLSNPFSQGIVVFWVLRIEKSRVRQNL